MSRKLQSEATALPPPCGSLFPQMLLVQVRKRGFHGPWQDISFICSGGSISCAKDCQVPSCSWMLLQGHGLLPTKVSALPCSREIFVDLGFCIMGFVLMWASPCYQKPGFKVSTSVLSWCSELPTSWREWAWFLFTDIHFFSACLKQFLFQWVNEQWNK